ncbi:cytochrome P450 2C70-like isoform X2 [Pimephales promelas]|uniref:cytochrome P450 2C70-like isoform X2 n=1 Tax=Pimephales promelas TaxID=90988 RepID=UPI001955AFAB|nr:cytochrome P450 2C70-like isoform X2 [Pimephales promelas]
MLGSLILLWICIFFIFLLVRIQRPKNFPPGPRPLPVFGNLLHVNMANPLKDLERFAERYGNIFSLYTGSRPAVFLNSFKVIKEALVTKAQDFSGRPQDFMISHISENRGGTVNPQNMFHQLASNVIGLVLSGSRFDYNNTFLQSFVQLFTEIAKILNGPWNMRIMVSYLASRPVTQTV